MPKFKYPFKRPLKFEYREYKVRTRERKENHLSRKTLERKFH